MVFKFIILLGFVAVASAGALHSPQAYHGASHTIALARPVLTKVAESYDPHPRYQYSYSVHDEHTGDIKSQIETRDGDLVRGEYSLIDADGYKRTVQYSADHDHGFNAIVRREPLGYAVKAAPKIKASSVLFKPAPVTYAASPALIRSAHAHAPAVYATHSIINSAPVAYSSAPSYSHYH